MESLLRHGLKNPWFKGTLCASRLIWISLLCQIPHLSPPSWESHVCQHGQNKCPQWCAKRHQQCWEVWQAPGTHSTQLKSHCQILALYAEAWYVGWSDNRWRISLMFRRVSTLGLITRQWSQHLKTISRPLPFKYPINLKSAKILHVLWFWHLRFNV